MIAEFDSRSNHAIIVEIYQIHEGSRTYSQPLGSWDYLQGLNITQATLFQRRSNFHNETVLIVPYLWVSGCLRNSLKTKKRKFVLFKD